MAPELLRKTVHYDRRLRRLWIRGQRCHHGATGALLAAVGVASLAAVRARPPRLAGIVAAGSVLMVHDWKDHASWFARGWQDD